MTGSTEMTPSAWSSALGPVRPCVHGTVQGASVTVPAGRFAAARHYRALISCRVIHACGGTCQSLEPAAPLSSCRREDWYRHLSVLLVSAK